MLDMPTRIPMVPHPPRPDPLSPRRLPRQQRARASVAAILEAAARILAERGLAGYTTNHVAERAGVSIGTLYQYFPNKDALMAALVAQVQAQRAEILEGLAGEAAGRPLAEIIATMVEAAIAGEMRAPQFARALDHEEARLALDAAIAAAGARIDAAIAGVLVAHLPGLLPDRAATMARTMRVMARAIIDDRLNSAQGDPETARQEAIAALLGYIERADNRGRGQRAPT